MRISGNLIKHSEVGFTPVNRLLARYFILFYPLFLSTYGESCTCVSEVGAPVISVAI